MTEYQLIEFGEACEPVILTRLMGLRQKTLFMLGGFAFNTLPYFLNENKFEEIYGKEYLTLENGTPVSNFESTINAYCQYKKIKHKKYGFNLIHDYGYDKVKQCITNYDFIVGQYDIKIAALREAFQNDKTLIFIHFGKPETKLFIYRTKDVINALKKHMPNPNKKFYILVFSNQDPHKNQRHHDEILYIKLDNTTKDFWGQPRTQQQLLQNEIKIKFYDVMEKIGIPVNIPETSEV